MDIDNYSTGSTLIILFVICSALGAALVRRIKGIRRLVSHHEVMGYFFPVAGSTYGVLLGLVVVNSITIFDAARDTVNAEASELVGIYTLAGFLPKESRSAIRLACRDYTKSVVQKEWTTMDQRAHHPASKKYVDDIFREIMKSSKENSIISQELLDAAQNLWKKRRERLDLSARTIPPIEWFVLCGGGVLVILFSYMFVMDSLLVQLTGTVMLSAMIALNIFLVLLFANPFSGDVKVSEYPLVNALDAFQVIDENQL
jgi:Protein of unknown function (DUF4239)